MPQQVLAQAGSNSSPPASPQAPRARQQAPRKQDQREPQQREAREAPPPAMAAADEHQDLTRAFAGWFHGFL